MVESLNHHINESGFIEEVVGANEGFEQEVSNERADDSHCRKPTLMVKCVGWR